MIKIKKLSAGNFRSFGRVIEYPGKRLKDKKKNLFRKILSEPAPVGWRIAYLVLREKAINKLEQHPGTFESFEPVYGKSLLYLARTKNPRSVRGFFLDKPVILKKGIWHGVVTLGKESEIKITENADVESKYWPLGIWLDSKLI